MNTKLSRVLDEIAKTEEKIAVWQEHLEELNIRKKQLEDAQIIKSVRSMKLGSREMLAFLESMQNGMVPVPPAQTGVDVGQAEGEGTTQMAGDYGKPETGQGETGNNSRPGEVPAEREDKEDEEKD